MFSYKGSPDDTDDRLIRVRIVIFSEGKSGRTPRVCVSIEPG